MLPVVRNMSPGIHAPLFLQVFAEFVHYKYKIIKYPRAIGIGTKEQHDIAAQLSMLTYIRTVYLTKQITEKADWMESGCGVDIHNYKQHKAIKSGLEI